MIGCHGCSWEFSLPNPHRISLPNPYLRPARRAGWVLGREATRPRLEPFFQPGPLYALRCHGDVTTPVGFRRYWPDRCGRLTAPEQLELPAVTIFNGFAVCARCARSRKSNQDKMLRDIGAR